ncbi:peptide chain release factor N(5)-glutamine methyltransferase [Flavicella sediminum]|uniref:peptide chain release factor N(5)-glutamine methyltransferase n=1 Tax=Flavicella sediminum TaxID=2585141 RepID=UPI00111DBB1D|nr:peptide chain release factor N(5)-glutamine methyltransferase [Flavicella sediminum]
MKITILKALFYSELEQLYPKTEITSFFNILVEFKLGLTRVDLALQPHIEVLHENLTFFTESIQQLKNELPIQYITGKTEFYSMPFHVNKNVLIPRPETEELVEWILDDFQDKKNIDILDIGTGSGCIAISLAKNSKDSKVTALDFSEKALITAKKNAQLNKVAVQFIKTDILATEALTQKFDVIVSNPPYVRELEKEEIQNNVLNNEPHAALFVPDDNALVFYKKIAELAKTHLKPKGVLYFEINQYLGAETLNLLEELGFTQNELRKDIFGNHRMTKSKR